MSEMIDNIRRNAALAELCIALAGGDDITTLLGGLAEYAISSESFVCTVLENIMAELRKLYTDDFEALLAKFGEYATALGIGSVLDISGMLNALRFFESGIGDYSDISHRVEKFEVAIQTQYTGVWRSIRLEMIKEMLSTILAWRGVSKYGTLVAALITELQAMSDEDIEALGANNMAFLRRGIE